MLFLGDDSLADGFRLVGFETLANPQPADVERLFRDMLKRGNKAFVIVDDQLMQAGLPSLERVRAEGGRIVVASVPRLKEPQRLASDVADRLDAMFGKAAGEDRR
jgi:vacuolar-type H+-ATPase subunit F/Vma7